MLSFATPAYVKLVNGVEGTRLSVQLGNSCFGDENASVVVNVLNFKASFIIETAQKTMDRVSRALRVKILLTIMKAA